MPSGRSQILLPPGPGYKQSFCASGVFSVRVGYRQVKDTQGLVAIWGAGGVGQMALGSSLGQGSLLSGKETLWTQTFQVLFTSDTFPLGLKLSPSQLVPNPPVLYQVRLP